MDISSISMSKQAVQGPSLTLPPSQFPFELEIAPGSSGTLHGNITLLNDTLNPVNARVSFSLENGYELTVTCGEGEKISRLVKMHTQYRIQSSDNGLVVNEPSQTKGVKRFLRNMHQAV